MHAALVTVLLLGPAAPEGEDDRPYVEILQSSGAIDGPAEGGLSVPRWERVRLELRVENRLRLEVHDLELDVALVSPGDGTTVIPGWSFRTQSTAVLPPNEITYLRIARELPARRTSPPADEIAYRVQIRSYRLRPPDLATAIELLGSPTRSDQRAALRSYQPIGDAEIEKGLGDELALALATLPAAPAASDALRMLFAVHAMGSLNDAEHVANLLYLPDTLDRGAWGRAVIDLATRMVAASEEDEPRLRVLPTWAREQSALLKVRAADTLDDAARDAILRMGDAAVPNLLRHSHTAPEPEVRARAVRLLHALGRSTVRSQLSLRDQHARLEVIAVLGELGSPEPVPALVEILRARDREQSKAAGEALKRIGASAVDPLVDALGTPRDRPLIEVLGAIADKAPGAIHAACQRYGLAVDANEKIGSTIERLQLHLFQEQRARLMAEVDRALELGREGSYTEAFNRLDAVFAQDAELYMSFAKPIAKLYVARGRQLFARGDYDATIQTVRTGLSIHSSPEATELLTEAQLQLALGLIELGELDRAQQTIETIQSGVLTAEVRKVEGHLLAKKARAAIDGGDYGRARTLIDRARAIHADDPDLVFADRRLLVSENLAVVIVLSLLLPAFVLAIVLYIRRRLDSARMERLATEIDRGLSPSRDPLSPK
jgi:tetratricopeptide (TPR) repeat protein